MRLEVEDGGVRVIVDRIMDARDARLLASGLFMAAQAIEGKPYPTDRGMDVSPRNEVNAALRQFCDELNRKPAGHWL